MFLFDKASKERLAIRMSMPINEEGMSSFDAASMPTSTPIDEKGKILFRAHELASRATWKCHMRGNNANQSICTAPMTVLVKSYFVELYQESTARLWFRHKRSLTTIDLSANELVDLESHISFIRQRDWKLGTGPKKVIKHWAQIWSHGGFIALQEAAEIDYDMTVDRVALDGM